MTKIKKILRDQKKEKAMEKAMLIARTVFFTNQEVYEFLSKKFDEDFDMAMKEIGKEKFAFDFAESNCLTQAGNYLYEAMIY